MNKVFVAVLLILLALPLSVLAEDGISTIQNDTRIDVVGDAVPVESTLPDNAVEDYSLNTQERDKQKDNITTNKLSNIPYKSPVSKRKIALKFLAAMAGVAISSLIIFVLLTIYNRIRDGFSSSIKTIDGETPLATPDDMESAVKTFLDKTNWKN